MRRWIVFLLQPYRKEIRLHNSWTNLHTGQIRRTLTTNINTLISLNQFIGWQSGELWPQAATE